MSRFGENTFVFEGAIVQPFAKLGTERDRLERCFDRARLDDRRQLLHRPARGHRRQRAIGENCFVGINATIRDGVSVAPTA